MLAKMRSARSARNSSKTSEEKPFKPAMLVLAEKAATKEEIRMLLDAEAQRTLDRLLPGMTQQELVGYLNAWLDRFEFAGFSRKKTVEQVAARAWRRWIYRTTKWF